jgi:hypothetical protein
LDFIFFSFGISWIIGLIIYITGGIAASPILIEETNFTLALVLLAAGYMMAWLHMKAKNHCI